VVAHDGVSRHVDGKDPCKLLDAICDPTAAMVEIHPGNSVLSAQKGTAHTAADAVVPKECHRGRQERFAEMSWPESYETCWQGD